MNFTVCTQIIGATHNREYSADDKIHTHHQETSSEAPAS